MKVIVIGSTGTIGQKVADLFKREGHEVIEASFSKGENKVDIADRACLKKFYEGVGSFDAVINATGLVAFAPFEQMTDEQWMLGLQHKVMGQVKLVQEALPYINEKGSFTLISGILSEFPINYGVSASMVNRAIEGFVMAAACELPKQLRINVVSPTMLKESEDIYAAYFPGIIGVPGDKVAQAFKRSVVGIETGKTFYVEA